jgi:hypothetical protein
MEKYPGGRKHAGEKRRGGGNAVAACEKQLGSCSAGKRMYTALCVQLQVDPSGDELFGKLE